MQRATLLVGARSLQYNSFLELLEDFLELLEDVLQWCSMKISRRSSVERCCVWWKQDLERWLPTSHIHRRCLWGRRPLGNSWSGAIRRRIPPSFDVWRPCANLLDWKVAYRRTEATDLPSWAVSCPCCKEHMAEFDIGTSSPLVHWQQLFSCCSHSLPFTCAWKLRIVGYQRQVGRWVTGLTRVHASAFEVESERWPISFEIFRIWSKGLQTLLTMLWSHEVKEEGWKAWDAKASCAITKACRLPNLLKEEQGDLINKTVLWAVVVSTRDDVQFFSFGYLTYIYIYSSDCSIFYISWNAQERDAWEER